MKRVLVPLLFLVVALTGCSEGADATRMDAEETAAAVVPLGTYEFPLECVYASATVPSCFEPSAAFDATGRLMVTTFHGDSIFTVDPTGSVAVLPSPIPEGVEALLQAAPDGAVWFTKLVDGGVAAARWAEGGWSPTIHHRPSEGTADRQWLAFGPASTWLVYTAQSTVWAVPYAGGSFEGPVRLAGQEERAGGTGPAGPAAVDAAGRLYVPFAGRPAPAAGLPAAQAAGAQSTVFVAIVEGGTVTVEEVHTVGPQDGVNYYWPTAALRDGVPVVVWSQLSGGLYASERGQDGWTAPTAAAERPGATRMPYATADGEDLVLAWYEADAGDPFGSYRFNVQAGGEVVEVGRDIRITSEGANVDSVALRRQETTDFAFVAVQGDRLAAPWYGQGRLRVAVLGLPLQST